MVRKQSVIINRRDRAALRGGQMTDPLALDLSTTRRPRASAISQ